MRTEPEVGGIETRKQIDQRRLAGAARAHDGHHRAGRNLQLQMFERGRHRRRRT